MLRTQRQNGPLVALVLGLAVGAAACGGVEDAGDDLRPADHPLAGGTARGGVGVVRLGLSDGKTSAVCTATVISDGRVITAGHCVDPWLTIRNGGNTTVILRADLQAFADYTEDGTNWKCLNDGRSGGCNRFFPMHVERMGNADIPPDVGIVRFATGFTGIKGNAYRDLSTASLRVKQQLEQWGSGRTTAAGTAGGSVSQAMMRASVRVTSVANATFTTGDVSSQSCEGDSGGPFFAGASNLIVGVASFIDKENGKCNVVNGSAHEARITPAVITFINSKATASDPACVETIAGTGFFSCF